MSIKRAIAEVGNSIGTERQLLFQQAYGRINNCFENGYYLEAITIIESLISDRLESRITFIKRTDFSFETLGKLINEIKNHENDPQLVNLTTNDLKNWKDDRNTFIHEMAKIADGVACTWEDRMVGAQKTAEDGISILRKIANRCEVLKRSNI